jgi:hypothetical protein
MDTTHIHEVRSHMEYKNTEIKLEVLVNYFNEERINLNPVFQRESVWNLKERRQLIKNIVLKRPIPAIFVYKDDAGTGAYKYNILDGKQRLESILLYIGYTRDDFRVDTWDKYIPVGKLREEFNFGAPIALKNKPVTIEELDNTVVRDLRDYMIPMIEINFNDKTTLDELIDLFVDINQQGRKVTRLHIVRTLNRGNRFLKDVYALVGEKRRKQQAVISKKKNTDFSFVLSKLQIIANAENMDQKVDRMWERLFELALFARSGKHRKPAEILKSFINTPNNQGEKITKPEMKRLRRAFEFLAHAYRHGGLETTRFATDQTHFYTLATTLVGTNILDEYESADLAVAIADFDTLLGMKTDVKISGMPSRIKLYNDISARQTSDSTKRSDRQRTLEESMQILVKAKGGKKLELKNEKDATV